MFLIYHALLWYPLATTLIFFFNLLYGNFSITCKILRWVIHLIMGTWCAYKAIVLLKGKSHCQMSVLKYTSCIVGEQRIRIRIQLLRIKCTVCPGNKAKSVDKFIISQWGLKIYCTMPFSLTAAGIRYFRYVGQNGKLQTDKHITLLGRKLTQSSWKYIYTLLQSSDEDLRSELSRFINLLCNGSIVARAVGFPHFFAWWRKITLEVGVAIGGGYFHFCAILKEVLEKEYPLNNVIVLLHRYRKMDVR